MEISKFRSELMGFAIAWTMLYHAVIKLPPVFAPLTAFKMLGLTGVDIFFLLSGLGLSYSWHGDPRPMVFLKKRAWRVLPAYWVFVALGLIRDDWVRHSTAVDWGAFFGIDFLVSGQLDRWFVPAILICYGLFVGYQTLVQKVGARTAFLIVALCSLALNAVLAHSEGQHLLIFTVRLPAFFLGVMVGDMLLSNRTLPWLKSVQVNVFALTVGLAAWAFVLFSRPCKTPGTRMNTGDVG